MVESASKTKRLGRATRRAAREAEVTPRLSTVRYRVKPVEVVSADELDRIHCASLKILQEVGIDFRDEVALAQWKAAGADVRGQRVHLDGDLVESLVAMAPERFAMTGRGADTDVEIGVDTLTFCAMQGAPNIRDLDGTRRASTIADLRKINRLIQMSPGFQIGTGFACEPTDIAVPWRHLHIMHTNLVDLDLATNGLTTGTARAEDCIAMARIVYGRAFMDENAVLWGMISGNSPLVWDATMLEGLRVFALANQVVLIAPFVLGAANTPADVVATVAQLNAEALAGVAYAQLVKPGTKTIYGQYSVSVSMKSGAPMSGMPEISLLNGIVGQLARRYNIPWRTTASQASSKLFDAQSGYESATAYMAAVNARANFLLHAGGWDEAGMVHCLNKLVVDGEQNLLMAKYAQGVSFDLLDEALDAVRRVGPGGHYLGDPFTLKHFRNAFIAPEILNYEAFEQWKAAGGKDMPSRAREKAEDLLARYAPPALDSSKREELDAFVARREQEISPNLA
ncbi:trimethylamine methyltransferase family protein [Defluviimonas sp. WL0024]|uniref:Methyltransferase n=1 Tax=Albidovulum salinarum TaxID=2984153 RepID=A0ABT2X8R3_9RHOB|nr:trimethylamine methyltransferase family protein [Defluviimonas sp. WL0024]MCU9850336.1 trimethylamine methyltransferase family protein [Defluviimonas sp. WL0024]